MRQLDFDPRKERQYGRAGAKKLSRAVEQYCRLVDIPGITSVAFRLRDREPYVLVGIKHGVPEKLLPDTDEEGMPIYFHYIDRFGAKSVFR